MSPTEVAGFVFGVLGVWLTVRENIWCWPSGIANVALYTVVFFQAHLYADMGLQVTLGHPCVREHAKLHPPIEPLSGRAGAEGLLEELQDAAQAGVHGRAEALTGRFLVELVLGAALRLLWAGLPWSHDCSL